MENPTCQLPETKPTRHYKISEKPLVLNAENYNLHGVSDTTCRYTKKCELIFLEIGGYFKIDEYLTKHAGKSTHRADAFITKADCFLLILKTERVNESVEAQEKRFTEQIENIKRRFDLKTPVYVLRNYHFFVGGSIGVVE